MKFNNIQTYTFLFFIYTIIAVFILVIDKYNSPIIISEAIVSLVFSMISGSIIIMSIFFLEKYKIYKWQKVIIWIVAILTTFAILVSLGSYGILYFSNFGAHIFDLLIACSVNVFILTLIFFIGNWLYSKIANRRIKCPECAEMIKKDAKKCRFCGKIIKQENE